VAKKLGNDYRLWIESTTAGTFNEIKGGQDLSVDRSGSTIDISSKDDFPYAAQAAGMRSVTINASFIPNLPDTTGYGRLVTVANSTIATPFKLQIRKGGSSGATGDIVFECNVYCTSLNEGFGQNDAVKTSATFVAA
jgi:hypothetical protein